MPESTNILLPTDWSLVFHFDPEYGCEILFRNVDELVATSHGVTSHKAGKVKR
jgi:hypothetical protein